MEASEEDEEVSGRGEEGGVLAKERILGGRDGGIEGECEWSYSLGEIVTC
jgi:hypothetical protein